MIKPTYYYKSFKDIDFNKIIAKGYKYVLCDLDNTLTSFRSSCILEENLKIIEDFKTLGLEFIVISNNNFNRVNVFCEPIGLKFLAHAYKPFTKKTREFIKNTNIDLEKTILIGDQLCSDIKLANKLKIDSVLVEPIENKDLLITLINRSRDKSLRKRLFKDGLLKEIDG